MIVVCDNLRELNKERYEGMCQLLQLIMKDFFLEISSFWREKLRNTKQIESVDYIFLSISTHAASSVTA